MSNRHIRFENIMINIGKLRLVLLFSTWKVSSCLIEQTQYTLQKENISVLVSGAGTGQSKTTCAYNCLLDAQCTGFSKTILDKLRVCKLIYEYALASTGGELCYIQDTYTIPTGTSGMSVNSTTLPVTFDSTIPTTSTLSSSLQSTLLTTSQSTPSATLPSVSVEPSSAISSPFTTNASSTSTSVASSLSSTSSSVYSSSSTMASNTVYDNLTTVNYATQVYYGIVESNSRSVCSDYQVLVGMGLPSGKNDVTDILCLQLNPNVTLVVDGTQTLLNIPNPCSTVTNDTLKFAHGIYVHQGFQKECKPVFRPLTIQNSTTVATLTSSMGTLAVIGTPNVNSVFWAICPIYSTVVWAINNITASSSYIVSSIQCINVV